MKLIVGLGNPGFRYRNTRHNVGFLVVKAISKKFNVPVKKKSSRGLLGKGTLRAKKAALFTPLTFMNLSGEAVAEVVKKEKIKPRDALVICDDMDLKFGFIRLKEKGTSAGHKGIASVIKHLETSEFPRLRIGIGRSSKAEDAADFVLSTFNSDERPLLPEVIKKAAECAIAWLEVGPEKAMTKFNG